MRAIRRSGIPVGLGARGARWASARLAPVAAVLVLGACAALGAEPALGAGSAAASDGPTVRAFTVIEPDTATVGDRLRLVVRIERGPDVEVTTPDVAAAIAPLEILESASLPPVERDGLVIEERMFVVAAFETGLHAVPSLRFRYADADGDTGSVRTDSTSVAVVSVLPEDEEELAPRDIKPPLELPRRIWPFVLAAAAAAGLLLAYRYVRAWWRARRRPADVTVEEPAVPPRAAHLVAFERLEALRRDDPIGRGEIEGFYVVVTDIVRRYIRDRFAVDAIDMTTAELEPALLEGRIEPEEVARTVEYLGHADLAKFAKLHPDADRARTDLREAWDLVERTRFRDEERGGSGGAGPAAGGEAAAGGAGVAAEDEASGNADGARGLVRPPRARAPAEREDAA